MKAKQTINQESPIVSCRNLIDMITISDDQFDIKQITWHSNNFFFLMKKKKAS